jgi:hypothetical protein
MTYIDIIAEDTVDEKIVKALRNIAKMNIASKITGDDLKFLIGFNYLTLISKGIHLQFL